MIQHIKPIERHLQTLLVSLIILLLAWVASTVNQNQLAIVRLLVKVESLESTVREPDGKFKEIERRLDSIEKTLHRHTENTDMNHEIDND